MTPQMYVVTENEQGRSREVHLLGYRLGTVRVTDRHGDSRITAYFVLKGEDERSGYMLTHTVTEGGEQIREDWEEFSFVGYYGVRLTYPLVWSPPDWEGDDQPCDILCIRNWFPSYESWGC